MTSRELTGVLAEIAAAAGESAALRLAADHGGTEIYVPENPAPDSPLAVSVGLDAARRIAEAFGRGRLLVPLGPFASRARGTEAIVKALERGETVRGAARAAGRHIRTVYRKKLRAGRRDDGQGKLF